MHTEDTPGPNSRLDDLIEALGQIFSKSLQNSWVGLILQDLPHWQRKARHLGNQRAKRPAKSFNIPAATDQPAFLLALSIPLPPSRVILHAGPRSFFPARARAHPGGEGASGSGNALAVHTVSFKHGARLAVDLSLFSADSSAVYWQASRNATSSSLSSRIHSFLPSSDNIAH